MEQSILELSDADIYQGNHLVLKDINNTQAIGSAITYARRYGLCLTFGLCDQECDDDGNAGSGKPKQSVPSGKTFNMRGAK